MNRAWQDPPEYRDPGGGFTFAAPALSPLIKWLMIANAALFVVGALWHWATVDGSWLVSWSGSPFGDRGVAHWLGVTPDLWVEWFPFLPVWQLVTYGFLHSVDSPFHLLMNMLVLYFLGTMLEGFVGSRRFLTTYLLGVVAGGVGTLLAGLVYGGSIPTIGASGGVLTVVVACAVLRPQTRIIFIIVPLTLKLFAIIYVGIDLFAALKQVATGASDGVAHFAHLGGAAYGFFAARSGWIWKDPAAELDARRERRAREKKVADEHRVDALLDRIHREGIQSLSERERAFLKRVSKRR